MAAGIRLVTNPDYCSPNDLARSNQVILVPDSCVEADEGAKRFAETQDPNTAIQQAAFVWLGKARKLALRRRLGDIATESDVGELIARNPSIDRTVCNYIRASKYLDYYNVDRGINAFRYDKTLFMKKFPDRVVSMEKQYNSWASRVGVKK